MSSNEPNVRTYSITHALISAGVCAVLLVIAIILWRTLCNHAAEPAQKQTDSQTPVALNRSEPADTLAGSRSGRREDRIDTTDASLDSLYDKTRQKVGALEGELHTARTELVATKEQLALAGKQIDGLFDKLKQFEIVRASSEAQNVAVQERAETVLNDLHVLTAELTSWNAQFTTLLASDTGKRIVAAGDYLDFFSTLLHKHRPSQEEVAVWRKQLDKLIEPLRTASERPGQTFVVTEDFVTLLDGLAKTIRHSLDELRQDKKMLDVIVRDTAAATPADVTLEQALARRREEEIRLLSQRVAQARKSELENSTRLLEEAEKNRVAAEAAKQKQEIDNERQRVELATQKLKDDAAAEKDAFAAQQAKARLVREMDTRMQEIQDVLKPFITPGFTQPLDQTHVESTIEKKPVSYAKIQGLGALDNDMRGMARLLNFGASVKNDRPKGGFPVLRHTAPTDRLPEIVGNDPQLRAKLQRAQELLNRYGPLLVERGLLSP